MEKKISGYVGGIILFFLGVQIWIKQKICYVWGGVCLDFSGVSRIYASAFLVTCGICIFYAAYRSKVEKKKEYLICKQCQKVYICEEYNIRKKCDICNIDLEKLDGFYDRNPNLKEKR